MMNSKLLLRDFLKKITLPESRDEIISMGYLIFQHVFGISRTDIIAEKAVEISAGTEKRLEEIVYRLNQNEPVQYVLGEAYFFGRKFLVNPAVLIPRGETEELVAEVRAHLQGSHKKKTIRILDIGTGSGCIPITLVLEIPDSELYATDVSSEALLVAKTNAQKLGAAVTFLHHDILQSEVPIENLDVIVSNPPYVAPSEQDRMKKNVISYEPHLALFVPETEPLVFYQVIAEKAKKVLNPGGLLAVEINEKFGREVSNLFLETGFHSIEIKKDLQGKDRIVKGQQPMR